MRPNSVCMPVAVTSACARPSVTAVPANTMFVRSPTGRSGSRRSPTALTAGTDSPVSGASCTSSRSVSSRRASPATRSPARSSSTSPGTRSRAAISASCPSRSTRAAGAVSVRSASIARSARYSCTKPSSTASETITAIATASTVCPRNADSAVATSRMTISTFLSCAASTDHGETRWGAVSSFGPNCASRRRASADGEPRRRGVESCAQLRNGQRMRGRDDRWCGRNRHGAVPANAVSHRASRILLPAVPRTRPR